VTQISNTLRQNSFSDDRIGVLDDEVAEFVAAGLVRRMVSKGLMAWLMVLVFPHFRDDQICPTA
jgi:hypothetical protein